MENGRSTDDEMSRGMWEEIENRKTDKTRMKETGREGKEEGNKKADDRQRDSNSENSGRERERVR